MTRIFNSAIWSAALYFVIYALLSAQAYAGEPNRQPIWSTANSSMETLSIKEELKAGGSLAALMSKHGISDPDIYHISRSLGQEIKLTQIKPGLVLYMRVGQSRLKRGGGVLYEAIIDHEDNIYRLKRQALSNRYTTIKTVRSKAFMATSAATRSPNKNEDDEGQDRAYIHAASFKISRSIYVDAINNGLNHHITKQITDLLSTEIDTRRDVRKHDQIDILYRVDQDDKEQLIYLSYKGTKIKNLALYGFYPARRTAATSTTQDILFFYADGHQAGSSLFIHPVKARISSNFGKRWHPTLKQRKMHKGMDYAAPAGTPIRAAMDGVIDRHHSYSSYGKYIRLKHDNNYHTAYAHMSRFARGTYSGKVVKQGEVIGYVGSSGRSTGAHLHFEVLKNNRHINPKIIVEQKDPNKSGTIRLAGHDFSRFTATKKLIDKARLQLTHNKVRIASLLKSE